MGDLTHGYPSRDRHGMRGAVGRNKLGCEEADQLPNRIGEEITQSR